MLAAIDNRRGLHRADAKGKLNMSDHARKPSRFSTRVNSLGLPASGLMKMLDALESTAPLAARRRGFVRWPFRKESVQLTLLKPGEQDIMLVVACRNISTMGISLLHCAYLHPGMECAVVLPGARSEQEPLRGRVARCIHRTGMLHEVGVEFSSPIDLRKYVPVAMQLRPSTLEKVDVKNLRGVLVHYCESREERAVVRERFRSTSLVLKSVADRDGLYKQLSLGCDAVVIDAPLEHVKEFARAVASQTRVAIGGIAGTTLEGRMMQLSVGGLAGVAVKPFTAETMTRFVAELLHMSRLVKQSQGSACKASRLRALRDEVKMAMDAGDARKCAAACREIEIAANEAGLDDTGFAAARARGILNSGGTMSEERVAALMRALLMHLDAREQWNAA